MERPGSSGPGPQARRHDNDWLTVLAVLVIFFYHCARFFNFEDWHVKNGQLDEGMSLFVAIVTQWIMPLFFLLSGMSSCYSLGSRTGGRYIGNRFRRLVIPLLFGTFVLLIPAQVWVERASHAQFEGTFIEFYPHYFEGFYAFGGNFAWMGLHLWYLEMLFVFTLLTFPLFVFLKKSRGDNSIAGAPAFFAKKGAVFLLGLPLLLSEGLVNLQPEGVGFRGFGGWSPFSYLAVFATGFLIARDPRCREALGRYCFLALALGLTTTGLMFLCRIDLSPLGGFERYLLTVFCRSFNSWFWLVAFLGFGSRFLDFRHKLLPYAREAALPFYILHQTIIVVVGFQLVDWQASVMVKYATLSTISLIVIMAIYEGMVKRVRAMRFVFGMQAPA